MGECRREVRLLDGVAFPDGGGGVPCEGEHASGLSRLLPVRRRALWGRQEGELAYDRADPLRVVADVPGPDVASRAPEDGGEPPHLRPEPRVVSFFPEGERFVGVAVSVGAFAEVGDGDVPAGAAEFPFPAADGIGASGRLEEFLFSGGLGLAHPFLQVVVAAHQHGFRGRSVLAEGAAGLSEASGGCGEVEPERVLLSRVGAQGASEHLRVQGGAERGAEQHAAVDAVVVVSGCEQVDVDEPSCPA